MPRIKHRNYVVEYDQGVDETTAKLDPLVFEVRVITADILDAEQAAPTYGINDPARQSIALNTMWIWAAARRMGHIGAKVGWPEFRVRCIDWRPLDEVDVPPTQPGASSDSSSPSAPDSSEASTFTAGGELPAMTSDS